MRTCERHHTPMIFTSKLHGFGNVMSRTGIHRNFFRVLFDKSFFLKQCQMRTCERHHTPMIFTSKLHGFGNVMSRTGIHRNFFRVLFN